MELKWIHDGITIRHDDEWFADIEFLGKTVPVSNWLAYNQQVMEDFGIQRVRDWLKWFLEIKPLLKDHLSAYHYECVVGGFSYWSDVPLGVLLGNETYDTLKDCFSGRLMEPPLSFTKYSSDRETPPFQLLENNQQEPVAPLEATVQNFREFGIRCRVASRTFDQGTSNYPEWEELYEWNYKMDPLQFNFFRKNPKEVEAGEEALTFGIELEVSTRLSCAEIQRIVTDVEPKQEPFFIFKKDSSISGKYPYLVELVTVPCSPAYLRTEWRKFFSKLEKLAGSKGKSVGHYFDTSRSLNNGLHIHVNKKAFYKERKHLEKFVSLFNQSENTPSAFLTEMSGRPKKIELTSYCKPDGAYRGVTTAVKLKTNIPREKYTSCHGRYDKTVEVRIFQGTFDLNHILKCIDFTEAMFYFSHEMSLRSYGLRFKPEFLKFIYSKPNFKTLKRELKACA